MPLAELLARRPGWGGGKPNALTLSLAPLSDADTARLVESLLGPSALQPGQEAALLAHAGGNPLYAEQYAQMLTEHRASRQLPVPESVQGIISARLDALPPAEKRLLQDAAVIGKLFWPGAAAALGATPRPGLEESPHGLERKQFIRRERHSSLAGETQYAFLHVLLRDAAYGQIPRATRAGKHLKAAGWIESLGRPDDHAEMLAHHYLAALELARAAHQDTTGLAARARPALQRAGDHALALNAYPSAARLYRAALALWPQDAREQRAGLLRLLGTVLYETGDLEQAEAVLLEGSHVAAAAGMLAVQARIRVLLAEIHAEQDGRYAEALEECEAAAALLQSEGDSEGLAEAWLLVGKLRFWRAGDPLGAEEALERAGTYARLSANHRAELESRSWLVANLQDLPIPVDVAVGRAERLLEAAPGDPWAGAGILPPLSRPSGYARRFPHPRGCFGAGTPEQPGFLGQGKREHPRRKYPPPRRWQASDLRRQPQQRADHGRHLQYHAGLELPVCRFARRRRRAGDVPLG